MQIVAGVATDSHAEFLLLKMFPNSSSAVLCYSKIKGRFGKINLRADRILQFFSTAYELLHKPFPKKIIR